MVVTRTVRILACAATAAIAFSAGCCSENPAGPEGYAPTTIRVDAGGGGDYATIWDAIDAAREGDTILVAPGTYAGPGNRDVDFGGVNVVLKAESGRDSTVIDCEGEGRAFLFESREDASSVIEGFIITNGSAAKGGAIRCVDSSPTIRDIVFRSNRAGQNGGALYCEDASPALTDVVFRDNAVAGQGAESGGAVFCLRSSLSLDGSTFVENRAPSGGAIASIFSAPTISDAVFVQNESDWYGGALFVAESTGLRAEPSIENATMIGNSSRRGAGMSLRSSSPTVVRVSLVANTATFGSGIFCEEGSSPSISNTIIALGNSGGPVICSGDNDVPMTTRSCVFGNVDGDTLCGAQSENLYVDPLFCDPDAEDVSLCEDSPCLPGNNVWGELIGALPAGCAACGG